MKNRVLPTKNSKSLELFSRKRRVVNNFFYFGMAFKCFFLMINEIAFSGSSVPAMCYCCVKQQDLPAILILSNNSELRNCHDLWKPFTALLLGTKDWSERILRILQAVRNCLASITFGQKIMVSPTFWSLALNANFLFDYVFIGAFLTL